MDKRAVDDNDLHIQKDSFLKWTLRPVKLIDKRFYFLLLVKAFAHDSVCLLSV